MAEIADLMFVAAGRWVAALDRFTGRPEWRQKMPRMFGGLITLMRSGREVDVGRGSYVYCLDARAEHRLEQARKPFKHGELPLAACADTPRRDGIVPASTNSTPFRGREKLRVLAFRGFSLEDSLDPRLLTSNPTG